MSFDTRVKIYVYISGIIPSPLISTDLGSKDLYKLNAYLCHVVVNK